MNVKYLSNLWIGIISTYVVLYDNEIFCYCHLYKMNPPLLQTLLSTIQRYQRHNLLPPNVTHPFASSAEESYALLQDLTHTTDQLVNSLNIFASAPLSNPKLVSLLRQYSSIAHTSHQVRLLFSKTFLLYLLESSTGRPEHAGNRRCSSQVA